MKNNSFKKSVAIFSLIAFGAYGGLLACADYFWGYDYDSSFTPETYVDKSYLPLFFAPNDVFYSIGFDSDHTIRFNDVILADWSGYLKGKMTTKELSFFLLNDSAVTVINQLYTAIQKKQSPPAVYSKLNLADEKVRGFIEFMYHAKTIEVSSTQSADSWNYDEKKAPVVDYKTVVQVEKLYTSTSDAFLKNRYWFQTMKAYFYSQNKQSVIPFFEKTKASVPENTLYYRGLSYVAGAHYSRKNYTTSNYLYSVVFDKCPELRTVTAYNFHPQEEKDFRASLALAKTPAEKTGLWALFGYYADEKTAIREIYALNPTSTHLDYLLTRLVNKEEVRLNDIAFKSADDYRKSMKEQQGKDALQLVNTIAKEEKTGKPYLWNIAAGYLNIFTGNHSLALQLLEKGEKQGPKTDLAAKQIRLLKLINTLSSITVMDAKAESKVHPELQWLYITCTKNPDDTFRYTHALTWSKRYISSLYQRQQNPVLAELFNRDDKFYQTVANQEAMKSFMAKSSQSPWEQLAKGIYNVTLSDIYEYQAVMSAYTGNLDAAISFMEKSDQSKDAQLLGNPFNGKIKDCHDCDHAATQKVKYTKLSFLKKMKEMRTFVDKGEDVYNNSLLLGNAFYNMTYFGNARVFYYGAITNQYSNYIDPFYQPQLLRCANARQYYQKAFEAAANPEQKAKCVYMLAKCERNEFYTDKYHSANDFYGEPEVSFLAWDGFKKLKNEYASTRYYKEVISECGYFQKYIEGN
ncbi:hypothetical protein [Ohtaekwangia koreensis]|uniref:Uncharacterized protein n=1 Tax=Ohtaekwangia koreensis TaxID=688867 RepID=A0A1T5KR78_9BACT|nr:hypothetical protein [Ohtaekwangia koreensis]SKC66161.1 hypothetical protein SAMN05660236_2501 [Ohtaekwangia koreensis]